MGNYMTRSKVWIKDCGTFQNKHYL